MLILLPYASNPTLEASAGGKIIYVGIGTRNQIWHDSMVSSLL